MDTLTHEEWQRRSEEEITLQQQHTEVRIAQKKARQACAKLNQAQVIARKIARWGAPIAAERPTSIQVIAPAVVRSLDSRARWARQKTIIPQHEPTWLNPLLFD
jgi:hypothetical protein